MIGRSFDPNGNLPSVTDPQSHAITYTYDSMDRPRTSNDPLTHQDSSTFDAGHRLTQVVVNVPLATFSHGRSSSAANVATINAPPALCTHLPKPASRARSRVFLCVLCGLCVDSLSSSCLSCLSCFRGLRGKALLY